MTPDDPHPIDALVRRHLDREAAGVDAGLFVAHVRQRQHVMTRRSWLRWAGGAGAALAAGVGGLAFLAVTPQPALAGAEELVREAKAVHAAPADRCYTLTAEWEAPLLRLKLAPPTKTFRVWTRGDRFWLEPADEPKWAMGQEPNGRVWFAVANRKVGLVYDPAELDEPLLRFCELVSLRMVTTLGEMLEQFTLYRKDAGTPGEPVRIEADIRPTFLHRNPRFRRVELELDPIGKAVESARFDRQVNGEPAGRLTFDRLPLDPPAADSYDLRGHLDPAAEVLDRSDRRQRFRDEFMKRWSARVK